MNERQIEAVNYVKKEGNIKNKIYRDIFDVSKRTATSDLTELVEMGILNISEHNAVMSRLNPGEKIFPNMKDSRLESYSSSRPISSLSASLSDSNVPMSNRFPSNSYPYSAFPSLRINSMESVNHLSPFLPGSVLRI